MTVGPPQGSVVLLFLYGAGVQLGPAGVGRPSTSATRPLAHQRIAINNAIHSVLMYKNKCTTTMLSTLCRPRVTKKRKRKQYSA